MKINYKKVFAICFLCLFVTTILIVPIAALGGTATGSTFVYIRGIKSGKYIDVPNGTVSSGNAVQLYTGNETLAQRWKVQNHDGNWCTITSALNSNYYLYLSGSGNGATIILKQITSDSIPNRAQFRIDRHGCGVARIINRANFNTNTHRYLEASGGNTSNGTQIVHWTPYTGYDAGINQLWVFESTTRRISTLTWDLVDSGGHCDWGGSTKYQALFDNAVNSWNNYMGITRFRKDTVATIRDVYISDVDTDPIGENAFARTDANGFISFYVDKMDNLGSNAARQKTIMHELGHALGLDHNNIYSGDIMRQGELAYSTSLSLNDKASYNSAKNNY